jgi:hypothetical protein
MKFNSIDKIISAKSNQNNRFLFLMKLTHSKHQIVLFPIRNIKSTSNSKLYIKLYFKNRYFGTITLYNPLSNLNSE